MEKLKWNSKKVQIIQKKAGNREMKNKKEGTDNEQYNGRHKSHQVSNYFKFKWYKHNN